MGSYDLYIFVKRKQPVTVTLTTVTVAFFWILGLN